MFKRLIAAVVILAFTNVYGNAPLVQKNALNSAFNELEYSLTVEWDQQDQEVASKMLAAFEAEVKALQKEGLSNSDLIEGSLSRIKNQKTQEEIKALFEAVEANEMTPAEARDFVVDALREGQVEGANWTGNRLKKKMLLILAVILVLVVVVVVVTDDDDDDNDDNDDTDNDDDNDDNDDGDDDDGDEDDGDDDDGDDDDGDYDDDDGDNDDNGPQGNNGWGNCDQDAPGNSGPHNSAENDEDDDSPYPGNSGHRCET